MYRLKYEREQAGVIWNIDMLWWTYSRTNQVEQEGVDPYFINGQDSTQFNWMEFVNCARYEDEHNVIAYQYHDNIYYQTIKSINPASELLVWYEKQYAKECGIDTITEGKSFVEVDGTFIITRLLFYF